MPRPNRALDPYVRVLGVRAIRDAELVGFLSRVPNFGISVLLTLHIVQHLDHRYWAAGLAGGVFMVAATISGPWRGHQLDRLGLRRTMLPSLVVVGLCIAAAPLLPYWWLLALMVPLGAMSFPTFSILRQVMVANAPDDLRRSAMSFDSVAVEFAYMAGPTLAVLATTVMDTGVALWVFGGAWVLGSALLTLLNPSIRAEQGFDLETGPSASEQAALDHAVTGEPSTEDTPDAGWFTPRIAALFVALAAAGFVLGGVELAAVAGLRALGHPSTIGWMLAIGALGSAVGGLVHGAIARPLPVPVLLLGLAVTTIPMMWARSLPVFAVLLLVNGAFCAPTLSRTAEVLSRLVPARALGQAMGWHGSALNAGTSIAPPLVGAVMDAAGWGWGFLLTGVLGMLGAFVLIGAGAVRRRPGVASSSPARP